MKSSVNEMSLFIMTVASDYVIDRANCWLNENATMYRGNNASDCMIEAYKAGANDMLGLIKHETKGHLVATKHTQGPWSARGTLGPHSNPSLKGPCVVDAPSGYVLATMNGWRNDEQEANARLIAAAPAMLEVLQWIIDESILPKEKEEPIRRAIQLAIGDS